MITSSACNVLDERSPILAVLVALRKKVRTVDGRLGALRLILRNAKMRRHIDTSLFDELLPRRLKKQQRAQKSNRAVSVDSGGRWAGEQFISAHPPARQYISYEPTRFSGSRASDARHVLRQRIWLAKKKASSAIGNCNSFEAS